MQSGSDRRKYQRTRKAPPPAIRVAVEEKQGYPKREIIVRLLDVSEGGFRIALTMPLGVGVLVWVDSQFVRGGKSELSPALVTWCGMDPQHGYEAGLRFENYAGRANGTSSASAVPDTPSVPDYYETLQLSCKADPDTIHRVYRLLAQRFHPDNAETGREETFRRLLEAYRVLSDPEQRAAYDARHQNQTRRRWKIFDQASAADGKLAERRKRDGILCVLYTRRMNEPAQPAIPIQELEDLLGCPREHLEFSLWFLKEKGMIARSDNGRYVITVLGAEEAERTEIPWAQENRMLPPPA